MFHLAVQLAGSMMMPGDEGPIYAETHMGRFPVEPWNTWSNLIFLLVLIYWFWRSRLNFTKHPITVTALPILALGFIGGTIYHASRNNDLWRILDAGPIVFLAFLASFYLWRLILAKIIRTALVVVIPALIYAAGSRLLADSHQAMIQLGYAFMGLIIIVPAFIHCRLQQWRNSSYLVAAGVGFIAAFSFRLMDEWAGNHGLPMGTHFLWHLFGGAATFFAMHYIFNAEMTETVSLAKC